MFAHGEGLISTQTQSMKKFILLLACLTPALVSAWWLVPLAAPKSPAPLEKYSRVENVVYYKNPQTGALGLYLSFELSPDHVYQFQYTRDGVTFFDAFKVNTTGNTNDVYESFNVSPCDGLWPRIIDLGVTE
jgi:hypothetical protein